MILPILLNLIHLTHLTQSYLSYHERDLPGQAQTKKLVSLFFFIYHKK